MAPINYTLLFNTHFFRFVDDIRSVFPDDVDLLAAENALKLLRDANPKGIVKIWRTHISAKYREHIMAGNIAFFLDKDYSAEVGGSDQVMAAINRLREPIRNMGRDNQLKTVEHMCNLTTLADHVR